jgi:hypothetical protein
MPRPCARVSLRSSSLPPLIILPCSPRTPSSPSPHKKNSRAKKCPYFSRHTRINTIGRSAWRLENDTAWRTATVKHDLTTILPPCVRCIITEAHGRHGKYVLYTRNGRIFARVHFIPPNPRTARQQARRALMAAAVKHWKGLDENQRRPWRREAAALNRNGYQLFIRVFMDDAAGRRRRAIRRYVRVIEGRTRGIWPSAVTALAAGESARPADAPLERARSAHLAPR